MSPQLGIVEGEWRVLLAMCIFSPVHLQWFMWKNWSQEADSVSEWLYLYSQSKPQTPTCHIWRFPSSCTSRNCLPAGQDFRWGAAQQLPSVCPGFPARGPFSLHSGDACSQPGGQMHTARTQPAGDGSYKKLFLLEPALPWEVLVVKNPPASKETQDMQGRSQSQEDPLEKKSATWQPTPVFLPGKCHGQRSLVGYSPRGHKETRLSTHTRTR